MCIRMAIITLLYYYYYDICSLHRCFIYNMKYTKITNFFDIMHRPSLIKTHDVSETGLSPSINRVSPVFRR
jgi:hypothetical protein